MNPLHFFGQADLTLRIVYLALAAMSFLTWYLILSKSYRVWRARREGDRFKKQFWQAPTLTTAGACCEQQPHNPFADVAKTGIQQLEQYRTQVDAGWGEVTVDEHLVRAIRQAISEQTTRLENGLTILGSVASTAPFVGLFGTVWGIYHALLSISTKASASLDVVAGPVGEALITTAAGLAVAIPAVLAYNAFTRSNRLLLAQLDGFAHDLHAQLCLASIKDHPKMKEAA